MDKAIKRRALTQEQIEEAGKLKTAWEKFKQDNPWATQTWLAAESGIGTQGAVGQYIRGIIPLNVEALAAICKVIQVSPQTISPRLAKLVEVFFTTSPNTEGNDANLLEVNEGRTEYAISTYKKPNETAFSVLDVSAACGNGRINQDYPEVVSRLVMPSDKAFELIGSSNRNNQIKVIVAIKDSMTPTINPNDLLFVDTSIKEYVGESIYILYHGEELVCKRLSLIGRNLIVSSDNKNYDSWKWSEKPDDTKIVGKVIRALPIDFKIFGN